MLEVTLELAQRVERFEVEFCALGGGAGREGGVDTLEVGGGLAVCGMPGSPLNKVLGLGLGTEVTDDHLDEIEDFYEERGVSGQIEMCPLAMPGLTARLNRRGYVLQGFENELARPLGSDPLPELGPCRVEPVSNDQEDLWVRVVSEGFASSDKSSTSPQPGVIDALQTIMRQFTHPDIALFLGYIDAKPAGGASSYVKNGTGGIFGTSTVPTFRRRGVQRALVVRAVNLMVGRADLVIATTEPGSVSQRTFERLGFQVLYTRALFVKE